MIGDADGHAAVDVGAAIDAKGVAEQHRAREAHLEATDLVRPACSVGDGVEHEGHRAQAMQDAAGQAGLTGGLLVEVDGVVIPGGVGVAPGLVGSDDDVGVETGGQRQEGVGSGGSVDRARIALPGTTDEDAGHSVGDDDTVTVLRRDAHIEEFARGLSVDALDGRHRRDGVAGDDGSAEAHVVLAVEQPHHVDPEQRVEQDGTEGGQRPRHREHRGDTGPTDGGVGGQREGGGSFGGDGHGVWWRVALSDEALVQRHAPVYVGGMDVVDALLRSAPRVPQRIACLTEETTETLYRLGLGDRVVGVSSFTVRPAEATSKPRVSSFLDANFDKLVALKPDLVVGFSDLQADIARELARRGIPVVIFNQRSIAEILQTIHSTAALVGAADAGTALVDELVAHLHRVEASSPSRRPRVYFEEWPDPCISAIRWVSELIDVAGGIDVFAHTRARHDARGRIISVADVIAADPDVIVASWCGKKVERTSLVERFAGTRAVLDDAVYEIPSELILQPGPAALSDGVSTLQRILQAVVDGAQLPPERPGEARRGDL